MSKETQDHIPVEQSEEQKAAGKKSINDTNPVGKVLDPVGKGLGTVLSPVGAVVGAVTKPISDTVGGATKPVLGPFAGTHEEKAEVLGGGNLDSYQHGKDTLGGHTQSGDNPLGLDQSGKFGFREE